MTDAFLEAANVGTILEDPLEVIVEGAKYTGWQEVAIVRSIDLAAGSFTLKAVPTFNATWPIRPLQAVELKMGGPTPILSGFVDSLRATSGPEGRGLELSLGRNPRWQEAKEPWILIHSYGPSSSSRTLPKKSQGIIFSLLARENATALIRRSTSCLPSP